jgi:radical SAM superfamily enzyme YgiQ (UPF0313 family)
MSTKKQENTSAVKIAISYPPLISSKGRPFLSQNRQFQWTNTKNIIYPVIPASAATLLKSKGYQIFWDDAIAQNLSFDQWFKRLKKEKPDYIAIETKTPVIKKHWQIIKKIKKSLPRSKVVLMGDHVTALPQESYKNCPVDYIIKGGHYDLLLLDYISGKKNNLTLKDLPQIDRELTQWQLYAYNNTNFKYRPGAYTMFGRDCWWGRCTFCSWTTLFPGKCYQTYTPKQAFLEVKNLIKLGAKEIFDDSGTFPKGDWLKEFCNLIIKNKIKIRLGCNMRFGALSEKEFSLMQKAGFRFMLFGFESANQKTLDKINKNNKVENVLPTLKLCKKHQIDAHITVMVGYPWESKKELNNTLDFAHKIFRENLAASLQATIIIPYPGTPLFKSCKKDKLLLTQDWDKYDMRQAVIKTKNPRYLKTAVQSLFKSIITPRYLLGKILSIRSFSDIKFLLFYAVKYLKKLNDFS